MAQAIEVNGVNGVHRPSSGSKRNQGLKVLIVGAGIGGLIAAVALRQQGHCVEIYEQSKFASETGAALHLAPNANGILRRLGIFAEHFGANPMERLTEYTAGGVRKRSMDLREANKQWQHPWLLAPRIELHNKLKQLVNSPKPSNERTRGSVRLQLSARVVEVDPASGRIRLEDGTEVEGDVVVGADGVHSVARKFVQGGDAEPFCDGKSAFRFLVPRQLALDDDDTRPLVEMEGELSIWYGADRRIIMYPTSDNTSLNFVCIHPEAESAADAADAGGDWNQQGNLERMLAIYSTFDPALLDLLRKAKRDSVKVWKLLDMKVLPTWTCERLTLLGDAAHPFLPHQGQGAGVAIEDAASLAVVLSEDLLPKDVPARLKLYEETRYDRANHIQEFSRIIGKDFKEGQDQPDMFGFTNFNFGHDEWDHSTQRLREWSWKRNPHVYWRMPIAFGPMPGPRQTHFGLVRDGSRSTFTTASIKFKTSRTLLQNLFPPMRKGWRFRSPGTVAYASFSQTTLNKMEWLGGSGYNHLGLYIHGVEYVKENGTVYSGTYLPILYESLTDPIVSGREELGMPKLYSSIDIYRRATSYRIRTGWQGALWGNFHLQELEEMDTAAVTGSISGEADDGILAYKYIPKAGRANKGIAAEEHVTFDPFAEAEPKPRVLRYYKANRASFEIDALDWEQLPTMHHVVSRLAELPIYEIVGAKVVEGEGVPDVSSARPV
ncbi:hypothetical protein BAUCODRAFT_30880 [Baudoinia panamericana UAMH 10762]|uniref:FAD-binding domain-containing protein n=1 Tax=Baudoinia panamericana (strain UAMH 10762) TaxID=717646 RepID=M2MPE6_BAUPA|nr:uncharacterized protein BAUCODRAFT_30880 [Baudoinia panamericana UAMH 10762]EMC98606.1 hypothetical protein BAUCODRAFT_30880 [Baudoinia panamericana UAMH 10762]